MLYLIHNIVGGTRYLHAICCDCTEKKNLPLFKYVPAAKSILEKLIYSVKGMLVLNDSAAAFWMGNLVNKNLDGREIFSQVFVILDFDLFYIIYRMRQKLIRNLILFF